MEKARKTLEEYRRSNVDKKIGTVVHSSSSMPEREQIERTTSSLGSFFSFDLLDSAPFRFWRSSYEARPALTLLISFTLYIFGQIYFAWIEFGLVFFVLALLTAMCLSLGTRADGEVSAYSVFNRNCERLLGQMTAEHFERDVLQKRR